jgi:hypothetical protein
MVWELRSSEYICRRVSRGRRIRKGEISELTVVDEDICVGGDLRLQAVTDWGMDGGLGKIWTKGEMSLEPLLAGR